jgi:hypothetical protein
MTTVKLTDEQWIKVREMAQQGIFEDEIGFGACKISEGANGDSWWQGSHPCFQRQMNRVKECNDLFLKP